MLKPLLIGKGSNLDADATSLGDGAAVAFYNAWLDRANAIHRVPGLIEHDDTGELIGKVYEYYSKAFNTRITVCNGRVFAQYSVDGGRTELLGGNLEAGTKPTFCEDTNNIFVAANSLIYRITTGLEALGGNSPTNVTSLVYHGGFILANGPELAGDTTYSDDKYNGYELWEVYNNESRPDKLQTLLLVDNLYIYNIGPETLEVTYLGTNPSNPFEVNKGRISSLGTIAKYSPAYDGQSVFYLSEVTQSRKIVQNMGGQPVIIDFPVETAIESFERVDDAEGYTMAFRGQNFYCLHFPSANAIINEQNHTEVTLAYHIQKKEWLILAKWDAENGEWTAYRGCDFLYIEPWKLQLVGGRDGKTYKMYDDVTVNYAGESFLLHRWRSDNSKTWDLYRTIPLGIAGDYKLPADQWQCGQYQKRQHEFVYADMTDAGESFRAVVVSGQITHGTGNKKQNRFYRYDVKRGTNEFIINQIYEDATVLSR